MMRRWRGWCLHLCWLLLVAGRPATAITIDIDYTYDTGGFFPDGSPARASLEAAASYLSTILDDTFSAITTPPDFHSSSYDTVVSWYFRTRFNNPSTGEFLDIDAPAIAADQYIIYAGARPMSGTTAGAGGPGGYIRGSTVSGSGTVTIPESNQIDQITNNFFDAVDTRGETSGFSRWGGTISFDTSNRVWHVDHTTAPTSGTTDLYSVAIHELTHTLGFGQNDANPNNLTPWESWVNGSSFYGGNAYNLYGGPVPLAGDLSHWAAGTNSVVYGSATPQETAMDPDLTSGTRKRLTELDAAALKDIGWTLVAPPSLYGDYNNNGVVDAADYVVWRKNNNLNITLPNDSTQGTVRAADYTVWRTNFGKTAGGGSGAGVGGSAVPEPAAAALMGAGCLLVGLTRRQRRG